MSAYTHPLAFTVRAKETVGVDIRIAPEIGSDAGVPGTQYLTRLREFRGHSA